MTVVIKFRAMGPHARDIPLPRYETEGAAGMDLCAAAFGAAESSLEELKMPPGSRIKVLTGYAIELPPGYEGQVRSRSGLALRRGLAVLNAPGTIDSDYRGEIGVVLINHGREPQIIRRGARIAQLVVAPVARCEIHAANALQETERADGGFGSTGE